MQRQKHKHWEKLGVKSNKTSQMHFRPQVVFWATHPSQLYIYIQLDINLCFTGTQKNIICAFYINDGTMIAKKHNLPIYYSVIDSNKQGIVKHHYICIIIILCAPERSEGWNNIFTLGVEDNLLNKDINSWGATGFSFWKIENLNKSCHDHKVLILAKEFYIKLLVSTLL